LNFHFDVIQAYLEWKSKLNFLSLSRVAKNTEVGQTKFVILK